MFGLLVSRALIGAGSIVCTITILVLLAQIATPERKGAMMSMNSVVHHAGVIISSALAGILAGWYNWRLPFLLFAGLILMSMLPIAITFDDQKPHARREKADWGKKTGPSLREKSNSKMLRLLPIFAISIYTFFYRGGFRHTLIPLYGKDVFRINVATLGLYISLLGFIALVCTFVFGYLSDRYGRKAVLIPEILFSGISIMVLLLPEELSPFLMACIFGGVGSAMNIIPNILISDIVHPDSLGKTLGINRIFGDSGYFFGPIIVGILLDNFGFRVPLYVIATFSLFVLLVACFSVHNKPPKNCHLKTERAFFHS